MQPHFLEMVLKDRPTFPSGLLLLRVVLIELDALLHAHARRLREFHLLPLARLHYLSSGCSGIGSR